MTSCTAPRWGFLCRWHVGFGGRCGNVYGDLFALTVRSIPSPEKAKQWAYVTFQRHRQKMTVPLAISFLVLVSLVIGLLHGVLVTKVQGVVVPDPESEESVEQGSQDAIMVTIALSAHDVERWVWFAEGESGEYAQMWLTLENEQTDNSGTSPVNGSNVWQ